MLFKQVIFIKKYLYHQNKIKHKTPGHTETSLYALSFYKGGTDGREI